MGTPPAGSRDVCVRPEDTLYPRALFDLGARRPPELHLRGITPWPLGPRVAIVGARAALPYARRATRRIVAALALEGAVVVSGVARGVDAAAHRAALARGAFTVGVLGVGIDQVYPPEHATLYTAIAARGCLVSPWGAGEGVRRGRFPTRNRTIAALAEHVVLVQADARSGSRHTVACALALGRTVWIVPWPLGHEAYAGNAAWVAQGHPKLRVLARPGDLLAARAAQGRAEPTAPLVERLRAALGERPRSIDALARAVRADVGEVTARLLELEWTGDAVRAPGDRFRRRST
jgi:DNA processing protein